MEKLPESKEWSVRLNYYVLGPMDPKGFQERFELRRADLDARFVLSKIVQKVTYQKEQSPTGYVHWQCYVLFKKPVQKYQVQRSLRLLKGEDWQPVRDSKRAEAYCRKLPTRVDGPFYWPPPVSSNALNKIVEYN